jgi:MHS family proline/betaine transporter-like MFS transporter
LLPILAEGIDIIMSGLELFADEKFRKKFLAMAVGNAMEWYDFAIFGALADVIGEELFPEDTEQKALLKGLAVFGAAFLMRPLGGAFMGWIGDTMGTKRALEISIALMLLPSFMIGCIPDYATGGITSCMFLILLRLLQGLAVGGELVGAFIYTIEATGGKARGFWGCVYICV